MGEAEILDVAIIGGCGRVGLPLGLALADRGLRVQLVDIDREAVDLVNRGELPFIEPGAQDVLCRARSREMLVATTDLRSIARAESVVVVIGTPVDERVFEEIAAELVGGQLLVLRSTVYPGTTAKVERLVLRLGLEVDVAFCPERIAEGQAMSELHELPQIVASRSNIGLERAAKLFGNLTHDLVFLEPEEAEMAKLFANAWRYIKFATANQLFMMANDFGVDYERIRTAVAHNYSRADDLPRAGFAAGPCLFKDTLQLATFDRNHFPLGHASVAINEGLPDYVVARMEQRYDLARMTVGILGMAFKAGTDDIRSSLSYKLKQILGPKTERVLCHDPLVTVDPDLLPLDEVLERSDLLVIGTAHATYAELETEKPVIDIWGLRRGGVAV